MIAISLIILAGVFKAIADTLAHHFSTSVFKNRDTAFWNPLHPDNEKVKRLFKFPLDGWHIANSLMILCFTIAAVFNDLTWHWYFQIGAFGKAFVIFFNIFYNWILRRK